MKGDHRKKFEEKGGKVMAELQTYIPVSQSSIFNELLPWCTEKYGGNLTHPEGLQEDWLGDEQSRFILDLADNALSRQKKSLSTLSSFPKSF